MAAVIWEEVVTWVRAAAGWVVVVTKVGTEADVEDAEAMEGTTGTARTRMSSSHRGDSTSCSRC